MPGDTTRLPLVLKPENRDQTSAKDAKIINAFVEKMGENEYSVYKRPGLSLYASFANTNGGGVYNWQGPYNIGVSSIYSVFNNVLYNGPSVVGTLSGVTGTGRWSFVTNNSATNPQMLLQQNGTAYVFTNYTPITFPFYQVPSNIPFAPAANTTNGSPLITVSNALAIPLGAVISGPGIPSGSYVTLINSTTVFTISANATATATGVVLSVQGAGFPQYTVPGVAWLDETAYVMDVYGVIYGSNLNDLTTWVTSVNNIKASSEQDGGMAIARQSSYVVAIKQWTTECFYDAANPTGSPLLPVPNSKEPFGCVNGYSLTSIADRLIWLGTNRSGAKQVVMMENLKCKPISTSPIDRLLDNANCTLAWGWSHKEMGHTFYGLTLPNANLTLVYDLTSGVWYQWTDSNGNYFPIIDSTFNSSQGHILQHATANTLLTLSATNYNDLGSLFPVDLYTPKFDGGTRFNKLLTSLEVVGDTTPGSILKVRFSDNDYQSWTNFRNVNLFDSRPMLWDCGTFRQRAFHFRHLSNTPMRIASVDLQVQLGTL